MPKNKFNPGQVVYAITNSSAVMKGKLVDEVIVISTNENEEVTIQCYTEGLNVIDKVDENKLFNTQYDGLVAAMKDHADECLTGVDSPEYAKFKELYADIQGVHEQLRANQNKIQAAFSNQLGECFNSGVKCEDEIADKIKVSIDHIDALTEELKIVLDETCSHKDCLEKCDTCVYIDESLLED